MCGIVGYVGSKPAVDFILKGLRCLEYRGYDSAGIVSADRETPLSITRSVGRIEDLTKALKKSPSLGATGLGHTRWATHGPAQEKNSHPHLGGDGLLALVHNGVIENYRPLKMELEAEGYPFFSQTDSEVIGHLIARELKHRGLVSDEGKLLSADPLDAAASSGLTADPYGPVVEAVQAVLTLLRGTYGLGVLFREWPEMLLVARLGSPLVIGVGDHEHYVASDGAPLLGYIDKIIYLEDHEMAIITAENVRVMHRDTGHVTPQVKVLALEHEANELGVYPHYMLKEIYEQPEALRNAIRGRIDRDQATAVFGGLNLSTQQLRSIKRFILTACGTSWHSALVGEYMLEAFARLPVEVEYASELRYRNPPIDADTMLFCLTQSGETIDTLAAMREVQRKGLPVMAICNVVGSTIARESDGGIYLHAGPEVGVASTKAYSSQCMVLALLSLFFGRLHHLSFEAGLRVIDEIEALPDQVEKSLELNPQIQKIAEKYAECNNFLYLGRQYNFPSALEGALKLKEISYIHAEGYPAAEMKHGPIALVDKHTPSLFIVPRGSVYNKVIANMEEVKARGGPVIALINKGDTDAAAIADDTLEVPEVADFLQPIITSVPLQLFAYHVAVMRGCDVDKPRNLAKSVTVE